MQIESGDDSSISSTPRRTRSLRSPKKLLADKDSPSKKAKILAEEDIGVLRSPKKSLADKDSPSKKAKILAEEDIGVLRSPKKSLADKDLPSKKAKFLAEEATEVYDLTSVLQHDTASLSRRLPLRQTESSSHDADSASDTSDDVLDISDTMSLRSRTISQTSATSVTSTESVSSFTRFKLSAQEKHREKPTLTRSPKRRSIPAVVTNDTEKGIIEKSNLSPAMTPRTSRRRSTQPSDPSTPKKQKVHVQLD